jgi:GR25 family glycosyltransferase involved in LPS biosynthesis
MVIKDFFPFSYCTNMDYRPDRWIQAQEEIAKIDMHPQRISGVVFNSETNNKIRNGYIGCGLAHLNGLKLAREQDQNVFAFEDDILFIHDYINIINKALEELPENWDMFYLGGNICAPVTQVSDHLGRLSHAQATHAYGINKNFLNYLIDYLEPNKFTKVIDGVYANEIIPNHNCFITIPMVAIQRSDYSDIEGTNREFTWMEERYNSQLRRK